LLSSIAVVKVAPDEHFGTQARVPERTGKGITEHAPEVLRIARHRQPSPRTGSVVAGAVDLDPWPRRPLSGSLQERSERTVSRLRRIQMRIDEHEGVGVPQHEIEMLLVVDGGAGQPD